MVKNKKESTKPTSKALFIFVCFSSSTGKSTTLRAALSQLPKDCQVALLNVRSDEAELYKKAHKNTVILMQHGSGIRSCLDQFRRGQFVVIEDIISLANKDEESLRYLINYKAHHDLLRIVCVSHMLYKTKMLTLLPLFNFVLITLSPSSRGLLKIACSQGFHLDAGKTQHWLDRFDSRCTSTPGSFAYVNSAKQTLHFLANNGNNNDDNNSDEVDDGDHDDDDDDDNDDDENFDASATAGSSSRGRQRGSVRGVGKQKTKGYSLSSRTSESEMLEKRFAECFNGHERAVTAKAIFSVISKVLTSSDCSAFRPFDLSFAFAQRRSAAKLKRISIVDYIDCLLDASPAAPADPSYRALHRYLKQRCKLPKMFIRNPNFVLPDDGLDSSDESA